MARIIAVCGATGGMGGAVADRMLKETGWIVRAVTRDMHSKKAKSLKSQGAEVVYATYDDVDSLAKAFEGTAAVFAITNFWLHIATLGNTGASHKETEEILNIAKAAALTPTLQHFVLHSLPAGEKVAGKGYFVPHTDSKDRAVDEIKRTLPDLAAKSTFLFVGAFTQNLWTRPFLKPFELPVAKGKYAWLLPISRDTKVSFAGDAYHNVGVFVRAILLHHEICLPAKYVLVATDEITMPEALKAWSEVTGKPAIFANVSLEAFTELYGLFGKEVGLQYQMHDAEADMMKPYRTDFVTMEELGIQKGHLIGHKQALEKTCEKLLL